MKVILKSGIVLDNVQSVDATKNPIALFVWSTRQARDEVLSFKGITIRSSEIAAVIDNENPNNGNSLNDAVKMFENRNTTINLNDDDLPF
jgi:hypothetical protein